MRKKTIVFQVYDKNPIAEDEGIGEIQIPLWEVDLDIETDNTMELGQITSSGMGNKPVRTIRYPAEEEPRTSTDRADTETSSDDDDDDLYFQRKSLLYKFS